MSKKLMLGNEAAARGLYEAGCEFVSSYPGTPSTEITEFAAKYESKKLKENDIIAMRTGYPGIACLVPKKYEGCQTFTTLIVRLKAGNNPSYVCSYINSDLGKSFIEAGKVGVAQQNFGAKSLAKMPIKIYLIIFFLYLFFA